MLIFLGKAHDLVFDRRAIARTAALDLAAIHRRTVEIGTNDFVGRLGRPGQVAGNLRHRDFLGQEGKRIGWRVARLFLQTGPVDGPAIKAGRRPGFQTS